MSDKRTLGREEEAAEDLPHTRYGWGAAWLLVCGFVLTILAVPIWEFLAPRDAKTAAPPFQLLPDSRSVPEGSDFQRLEGHLEDNSAVWRKVRPPMQAQLTRWGGAGNSQVIVGQGGWLFYKLAVEHLTGPPFLDPANLKRRAQGEGNYPDPVEGLLNFAGQLGERGIRLIVVPVPVKASIYPDKLWAKYDWLQQGPPQNPSMDAFKRKLEARGVAVFDPAETLWRARIHRPRELQFFPTDTHWTPAGAALTGQALGDFVRLWGGLPERPHINYLRKPEGKAEANDLVRLLLGPPVEQTLYKSHAEVAIQVQNPDGSILKPDRHADVLLIGDSFAGSYAPGGAGLGQHLMWSLGRPIDTLTHANGGSWAVRHDLVEQMRHGIDRLLGKKLVIYEFTARDLSSGNWIPFVLPSVAEMAQARISGKKMSPTPTPKKAVTPPATAAPIPTFTAVPTNPPQPTPTVRPIPTRRPTPYRRPTVRPQPTSRPRPRPTARYNAVVHRKPTPKPFFKRKPTPKPRPAKRRTPRPLRHHIPATTTVPSAPSIPPPAPAQEPSAPAHSAPPAPNHASPPASVPPPAAPSTGGTHDESGA